MIQKMINYNLIVGDLEGTTSNFLQHPVQLAGSVFGCIVRRTSRYNYNLSHRECFKQNSSTA